MLQAQEQIQSQPIKSEGQKIREKIVKKSDMLFFEDCIEILNAILKKVQKGANEVLKDVNPGRYNSEDRIKVYTGKLSEFQGENGLKAKDIVTIITWLLNKRGFILQETHSKDYFDIYLK